MISRDKTLVPSQAPGRRGVLWLALVTLVGAAVRVVGCRNDLWLDEIISLNNATNVGHWWQVFTAIHTDNNHYLTSLYLRMVGAGASPMVCRGLSLGCGVATIPAGYWVLGRRSSAAGLAFAILLAASYPLIHFSSEARGYAGAVLAAVVMLGALLEWKAAATSRGRVAWGAAVAGAAAFGVLAHLTFCFVWGGLAIWALATTWRGGWRGAVLRWGGLNVLPAAVLGVLVAVDLRQLVILGGPAATIPNVISRFAALSFGLPTTDIGAGWLVAAGVMGCVVWHAWWLRKNRDDRWWMALVVVGIFMAFLAIVQPKFVFPRYLLVLLPFLYWPMAELLGRAGTRLTKLLAAGAVVLLVGANMNLYAAFVAVGRGNPSAAVMLIDAHSAGPVVVVRIDYEFRAKVELGYYKKLVPPPRELVYVPPADWGKVRAEWMIVHGEGTDEVPPATLGMGGEVWKRAAYYGSSELSGQAWTVYHLEGVAR
jgi:hypothetical protein